MRLFGLIPLALILAAGAAQAADLPAATQPSADPAAQPAPDSQTLADEDAARTATVAALRPPAPGKQELNAPQRQEQARAALAWGDKYSATNLMEKVAASRDTIESRFNLATAYQRTGRYADAAALYRSLVRYGRFTYIALDPSYTGDGAPASRPVKVADESARRLKLLDRLLASRPAAAPVPIAVAAASSPTSTAPAALSATEAGVNVVALEGRAHISDEEAIALDAQARAARVAATPVAVATVAP